MITSLGEEIADKQCLYASCTFVCLSYMRYFLSCFASSWCQRLAAACDSGTPWIFRLNVLIPTKHFRHTHIRKVNLLNNIWTASSEFGTYCLCKQRRFRRACASAQSRQNLRCSLIQAVSQEEPSDRKPDP